MIGFLLRPVRVLVQALIGNDSPRQTAAGLALGMVIGLLPKGNLLAIFLGVLLCSLQVNVAAGFLAMGVFSWVGAQWDEFAHRLGSIALNWPAGQTTYQWLYEQPLGPWLGYNNTLVMGQLLIGLYLLYPVYAVSRRIVARIQPPISRWLLQYRIIRWLRGAEWGAQWGLEG